jgi:hypothetical protein
MLHSTENHYDSTPPFFTPYCLSVLFLKEHFTDDHTALKIFVWKNK